MRNVSDQNRTEWRIMKSKTNLTTFGNREDGDNFHPDKSNA